MVCQHFSAYWFRNCLPATHGSWAFGYLESCLLKVAAVATLVDWTGLSARSELEQGFSAILSCLENNPENRFTAHLLPSAHRPTDNNSSSISCIQLKLTLTCAHLASAWILWSMRTATSCVPTAQRLSVRNANLNASMVSGPGPQFLRIRPNQVTSCKCLGPVAGMSPKAQEMFQGSLLLCM